MELKNEVASDKLPPQRSDRRKDGLRNRLKPLQGGFTRQVCVCVSTGVERGHVAKAVRRTMLSTFLVASAAAQTPRGVLAFDNTTFDR